MASGSAAFGERHGQFVIFEDGDGGRHAVRVVALLAASGLDQFRDATVLQLTGGRAVVVRMPLEGVLDWFVDSFAPRYGVRDVLPDALATWSVITVLQRLMLMLLDSGVLTPTDLEEVREDCLVMARDAAGRPPKPDQSLAAERVRDFFGSALPE
jgi:hypothetical protein